VKNLKHDRFELENKEKALETEIVKITEEFKG